MSNNKFKEVLILILFLGVCLMLYLKIENYIKNDFRISFLDVGQGDSVFINTRLGTNVLIDGGRDNKVMSRLGSVMDIAETRIDIVIATHDDLDHIFGLISVLKKYEVGTIFVSLERSENPLMRHLLKIAKDSGTKIIEVDRPMILKTSEGLVIKFLFPVSDMNGTEDSNDASIVTQIIYKDGRILLTGDLGVLGEELLVKKYGRSLSSQILKLGHHGSETSTSPEFLKNVTPDVGIVSAGADNSFGHPHKRVLDLVSKFGIQILETSLEGTITFVSDGQNIWRE